jgi:hypothetical protein
MTYWLRWTVQAGCSNTDDGSLLYFSKTSRKQTAAFIIEISAANTSSHARPVPA